MTEQLFTVRFKAILGRRALANIRIYKRWAVSPLPKPLVLLTLKDHLLAFDYVLQPVSIKSPKYLQVWEILKNLLALQAGSSAGAGTVCFAPPCVSEDTSEDESENESEDEPDAAGGEPEAPEDSLAGQSTVVGHEAAVKGEVVNSRSEFVLVRVPGTLTLPVRRGLDVVGLDVVDNTNGATPLLVGEVKAVAGFERDIWKPLSFALELMQKSPSQQPQSMWVFLTDVHTWDFVRVDRLPCSKGKAGGATAPGTATAPGGATAPGTATAPGGATVGSTTVPNTGTVGGAATGAAAAGAVPGGTKASGVKYAFQRFKPVFVTTMEAPDDGYLQLLAVLHHIIYPEEQLADLSARVSRSSEALQARAQAWLNGAETPQMRAKEEVAKAEARVAAAAEARAAAEETAAAEARVAAEAEARGQAEAKAKEADEARAAEAEARAVAEAWAAAEAEARAEAEAWAAAEAEAWAAAEVEARAAAQARVAAEARAAAAAEARAAAAAEAAAEAKARAAAEAKAKEADKARAAADEARAVA